ncbi:Hydroxyphenylpyruvate reductase [Ananas comosus]|uniref:Hydroxyphenylpyruvate reductase n=1 Tax=Ananas comosus TaxID=4615 RepID=A0A199VXD7_ANACO|nr:Hydroxyphenylpyruvate reductase [Ananas comosus]
MTSDEPLPRGGARAAVQAFRLWEAPGEAREFLRSNAPSIRALVGNANVGADADTIDALPKLEIVASFSVGSTRSTSPGAASAGSASPTPRRPYRRRRRPRHRACHCCPTPALRGRSVRS